MKTLNDVLQAGLRKNEVLALDIAEHCGYYSSVDNYGVAHFPANDKAPGISMYQASRNTPLVMDALIRLKCLSMQRNGITLILKESMMPVMHHVSGSISFIYTITI